MRIAAGFVMLFVLALSGVLWTWALAKLKRREPLLPVEPRRRAPWGLVDPVIAILILVTLQLAALAVVGRPKLPEGAGDALPDPSRLAMALALGSSLQLVAMAISMALIRWRTGASLVDLGFDGRKLASDLGLGLVAFVMLAPPVFAVQLVLVQFYPKAHPLIDLLRGSPNPWLFLASGFAVTIGAPLTEEYFFRGLLQGWLESVRRGMWTDQLLMGDPQRDLVEPLPTSDTVLESPPSLQPADDNPYVPPVIPLAEAADSPVAAPPTVPRWPMYASALFFALAHYSHGPAPIPLFLLALGLGYLYQRTHRLTPCIVVHFLLNSWTMLLLLIEVYFPMPK